MKDVEGRDQDKTRPIPTLNNGCYEILFFSPPVNVCYILCRCKSAQTHCLWGRAALRRALLAPLIPVPAPSLGGAHLWGDHEGCASSGGSPGNTTWAKAGKRSHRPPVGQGEHPGAGPQASAHTGDWLHWLPSSRGIREHPLQLLPVLIFHL